MKVVKKILLVIAVLIAIPLVAAVFIKKEYMIERQVTINKPKAEVFNYVKYLKNQDHYNIWVMKDPAAKKNFRGTDGTPGFVYAWDGNKEAGQGEQELTNSIEGERTDSEVRFERPMKSVAHIHMLTEQVSDNQTRVKWAMEGKSAYPINFMNLFMDNMLGKDMEQSLGNLKSILEKK